MHAFVFAMPLNAGLWRLRRLPVSADIVGKFLLLRMKEWPVRTHSQRRSEGTFDMATSNAIDRRLARGGCL